MGSERRDTGRRRSGEAGEATINGHTQVPCTILDTSLKGARLSFTSPIVLPKRFDLRFKTSGHVSQVTVMWQRGLLAGVRMAKSMPIARNPAKPSLRQRLFGRG